MRCSQPGVKRRRFLATDDQQAEVLRLLAAGASLRETAAAVFGSERFKDRAARIRRAYDGCKALGGERDDADETPGSFASTEEQRLEQLGSLVEGVRRQIEQRLAAGARVRPTELLSLAQLEWRLDQAQQFQELKRLTRDLN
jgi:hypothetical protein